jgi:hypothetical protein
LSNEKDEFGFGGTTDVYYYARKRASKPTKNHQKPSKSIKTHQNPSKTLYKSRNSRICETVWNYGSSTPPARQKHEKSGATMKVAIYFFVSLGGTS